ncbi:hypothetical protein Hte_001420 [Hypoxylon texense]
MATQQDIALEPTHPNGAISNDQASGYGQLTDSTVGYNHDRRYLPRRNGEYLPTAPYRRNSSTEVLNGSDGHSDPTASFLPNAFAFKRRALRLDTGIPESALSNGQPSANEASSISVPDTSSSVEAPNAMNEREKTLRTLESRGRPSTHRSTSPASLRRHRRSYQLATDPRIDPQQYSDFLDFLEHDVAMDVALRVRIWKSLIKDSENREGSATQVESPKDTGSRGELLSQYYCPLSPATSSPSSDRPGPSDKVRRTWQPNNRKVQFQEDSQLPLRERKLRDRQSCPVDHRSMDFTLPTDPPAGNGALRRSNAIKRHSYADGSLPRETSADKRRRVSAAGLAHSFTQYIKPELPATISRKPCAPVSSDRYETTSQAPNIPEARKE